MSIFGKLDAAAIPTNPFFIEEGEYATEVTEAKFQTQSKDGKEVKQLYIQFTIIDESSQFVGSKAVKTYNLVDEDLTAETLALLPPDDQKKIRQSIAALKRDLCGNGNNPKQRGLGVAIEDLDDPNWNPEVLKGTKADIGINNYGSTKEGVNVRWVTLSS